MNQIQLSLQINYITKEMLNLKKILIQLKTNK